MNKCWSLSLKASFTHKRAQFLVLRIYTEWKTFGTKFLLIFFLFLSTKISLFLQKVKQIFFSLLVYTRSLSLSVFLSLSYLYGSVNQLVGTHVRIRFFSIHAYLYLLLYVGKLIFALKLCITLSICWFNLVLSLSH